GKCFWKRYAAARQRREIPQDEHQVTVFKFRLAGVFATRELKVPAGSCCRGARFGRRIADGNRGSSCQGFFAGATHELVNKSRGLASAARPNVAVVGLESAWPPMLNQPVANSIVCRTLLPTSCGRRGLAPCRRRTVPPCLRTWRSAGAWSRAARFRCL